MILGPITIEVDSVPMSIHLDELCRFCYNDSLKNTCLNCNATGYHLTPQGLEILSLVARHWNRLESLK